MCLFALTEQTSRRVVERQREPRKSVSSTSRSLASCWSKRLLQVVVAGTRKRESLQGLEDVNIVVIDVGLAEPLGKRSKQTYPCS